MHALGERRPIWQQLFTEFSRLSGRPPRHVPSLPKLRTAGARYFPNVVRVGSGERGTVAPAVRERWVGGLVERARSMPQGEWQRRRGDLSQRSVQCDREIEALELSLGRAAGAQQAELAKVGCWGRGEGM